MNARHFFSPPKALAVTALLALAGAAHAGDVRWSVAVNAPIEGLGHVRTVVSNGQRYYEPQPVAYVQAPVVVQQPVYVEAPRYESPRYAPHPVVYYQPAPAPRCLPRLLAWGQRWHHHGERAYASGYGQGYEQGYERGQDRDQYRGQDDRRGWNHRD
jgi:hypothetical protein